MAGRGRIALLAAILSIVLGSVSILPRSGETDDRLTGVMGIVESVSGTVVSVAGKSYDLKSVPLRSANGVGPAELATLRGKTVEIVFRNGKVDSVTVFRTLPQ
jgi:hypothetical protein